ncbi:hypothetical protein CR970_03875 [Candidatus Saccharibacteria bacterium]|nr:MAG: hypothetical protein CR970_03875 [Candidatus Saccharibacteria bacterium]
MINQYPIAVLIRGLPGSGKTYIAQRLQLALAPNQTVMLDPDTVDTTSRAYRDHVAALTAEGVDQKLHLYRFLRAQAYQAIEDDKIIIWNQPFTNLEIFNKMVGRLRDHAASHSKQLPLLVVEVQTPPDIAKQRIQERKEHGGHGPSADAWERFINDYRSFADEGYQTISVHGNKDAAVSVKTIQKALAKYFA